MLSALLAALLFTADADAGEIYVTGLAPIITVDGVAVDLSSTSLGYLARDLNAGRHVLEARALNGGTIAILYVDVPADKRVLVQYRRKLFTVTGQAPLSGASTPPPAAPPPATRTSVGSVAFRGLDPASYRVDLAGKTVPWQPEWGAFIATDLRPGSYPVSLYRMGSLVMAGEVAVSANGHSVCTLEAFPLGVAGECAAAGPALPASELGPSAPTTTTSTTTTSGGGVSVQVVLNSPPAMPAEGAPPAPATPQPMAEPALVALVNAVTSATFGDDQVDVLRTAAAHNSFTCAQVVRLVAPIAHSSDKVEAITALAPKVLDPENAHVIEGALTFSSDKEAVRKLFR